MLEDLLNSAIHKAVHKLYHIDDFKPTLEKTPSHFEGDFTLVVFPLLRFSKKNPEITAKEIGNELLNNSTLIEQFDTVKGFLNLTIKNHKLYEAAWQHSIENIKQLAPKHSTYLIEYSSPNTNKPLHLGHIRNNLLGYSVSKILTEIGYDVKTIQIINDRGIHICKSMLAWQLFGDDETPKSSGIKGDHFVGKFYVEYEKQYQIEIKSLIKSGLSKDEAETQSTLNQAVQKMLRNWEKGDPDTISLWKKMNQWVYDGFEQTYQRLGVHFNKNYYESNTYILGKKVIAEGLKKGIFYKKSDGSVWIDLTKEGLDEKILLRSDGTSVYITQDIGTAIERYQDFAFNSMIYTVADEQDYHFKVLFLILKRLGYPWAERCHHLSYGMVTLPSGKMKSREGTVVDADDLMDKMEQSAADIAVARGRQEPNDTLNKIIGHGALKFQLLKVDPKKTVMFDPKESIDFHGKTGPFIQYTYARIQSLIKKYNHECNYPKKPQPMLDIERKVIKKCLDYHNQLFSSAHNRNPSILANYLYDLAKNYNNYYHETPILQEKSEEIRAFRMALSQRVANIIDKTASMLGITMPETM